MSRARKRAAKRRRINQSNFDISENGMLESSLEKISKEIDSTIKMYDATGKRMDLLYVVKLIASKHAIEHYHKALEDCYYVNLDQAKIAEMYGDAHSQLQMAKNAINGEKSIL